MQLHSQRTKINLDKTVFIKSIANSAWSLEDKTKKKDEEMFIMSFKDNILSIAYVDWIEGIYGSNTKYKLLFKDSIMEITPTSWKTTKGSSKKKDKKPPFVIYCYLQSTEKIVVLFKDERSEHFTKLLGDNEWLELTKFEK
ncbi:MAG: hypothetical protein ABIP51_22290 [Bacteroidia bacterium]